MCTEKDTKSVIMERGAFKSPYSRARVLLNRLMSTLRKFLFLGLFLLLLPLNSHADFYCGAWYWGVANLSTDLERDLCETLSVSDETVTDTMAERDAAMNSCGLTDYPGDDIEQARKLYKKSTLRLRAQIRALKRKSRK